jgi:PmbA protein
MLEQLIATLERHGDVHDWAVQVRRSRSVQVYLIGNAVESRRSVSTQTFGVEVYNDHLRPAAGGTAGEAARGVASIQLVPADHDRLDTRVDEAVQMARLVHNPPYALAGPSTYPDVPIADPALASSEAMASVAERLIHEMWDHVAQEANVRLSAAELFLTLADVELRNSRGVRATTQGTRVLLELVLLAGSGADEAENFRQVEARRVEDLRLAHTVSDAAAAARDGRRAVTPKTRTGAVVLEGDALVPLFEAFTFHASASAAYNKLARIQPGERVFGDREVRGDRLTLRSNALRPFGLRSHRFDGDGVPGRDVVLIQDGVLRARQATQRYGQYLGVPVTGDEGNTEVAPGDTPLAELLSGGEGDEPVTHVVAFSSPEVDPVTGDFGSEIRLGYEITRDGRRPIKGGSVSGNVFDAFADAHFSRDERDAQGYAGPRAVRFAELNVAGA